jgi:import inner membrane translocase subunit TIM23
MMYNGTTAMIDASRGTHDIFNSIAAGAVSGAIFKCTAGNVEMKNSRMDS